MRQGSRLLLWISGVLTVSMLSLTVHGQEIDKPQSERSNEKARLESGIVFAKGGDTELKLDLAMPEEGEGPFPAIICIHGGGWISGEREKMKGTIEILARRGYVAISPDYRLAPRHPFPAAIEDCKAAVRWLRANADKYHVNPQRIGAFGFSAGAHLACLLGVTAKEDGLEGKGGNADQSSAVQAVVSFFGPTDFTRPVWSKEVQERHLTPFLGGTAKEKAEVYRRASPLTYAGKKSPPFLFVHGTADAIVPIAQSEAMVEKLQEAGVSARLVSMDGEGHFWDWKHENRLKSIAHMMKFFDENLKK
jgi:acetyl esterase/lipase